MVFYRVLALFKVAVIIQQIYYRYHHGLTKDPRFAALPEVVKVVLRAALRSAADGSL
jgi:aminoglycoside phosphotransferase (APT) family kinase protein